MTTPCPLPEGHAHGEPKHHSRGCRCEDTREARNAYNRRIRREKAYGRREHDPFIPAAPSRKILLNLIKQGYKPDQIARESGLSPSNLRRIRLRKQKMIRQSTADRIEKINLTPDARAKGDWSATLGITRRLQSLTALGWTMSDVARATGIHETMLCRFRRGVARETPQRISSRIIRAYENMWDRLPPEESRSDRARVSRARNMAAEQGWLPPMAWDEERFDDPTYSPDPEALRPAEDHPTLRVRNLIDLLDDGVALYSAAFRAGYAHRDSAARALQRAGRSTLDWRQNHPDNYDAAA